MSGGGNEIRDRVREKYASLALARGREEERQGEGSCCGPSGSSCGCGTGKDIESRVGNLTCGSYSAEEIGELSEDAIGASLGCGNPVALATLSPGAVVLDLGSGGGIDVLLSVPEGTPQERDADGCC